jgi:tetratricopeptide (TPR) repeat protein
MVQDRIYGLTRTPDGTIQYSTSMLDTSRAVQFREGVRLGRALSINIDRLCHFAKKDMSHGRLEEAQEYYAQAKNMDPMDGRPYLGLSRIARRRGDLVRARELLREGIAKSSGGYVVIRGPSMVAVVEGGRRGGKRKRNKRGRDGGDVINGDDGNGSDVGFEEEEGSVIGTIPDLGPNPFLLQALGTLEQELGNLAAAEELYLQAIRSRPSHAAAWVALAQLRTRELRQGASAGRLCYRSAERELLRIGARPSAYVYTAWASMEHKKGSREDDAKCSRRARELYQKALAADPRCSAAYLQLGVMESECGNFDEAESCFEEVLKFDQRNSRVLQAYAIMESRRAPREDVDSRRVLDLFERALKANPRDAGVYQAYALYVAELGDVDSARTL